MRQLVKGILEFRGKAKENPYKKGELQVGLKFTIQDGNETIEEWVNAKPDLPWHANLKKGEAFYFVKEWSVKKKNKETGEEGAYAYRPVDIGGAAIDETVPVQPQETKPETNSEYDKVRRTYKLWLWMNRKIGGNGRNPFEVLLAKMVADEVITKEQAAWSHDEFAEMGEVLQNYGTIAGMFFNGKHD